MGSNILPTL